MRFRLRVDRIVQVALFVSIPAYPQGGQRAEAGTGQGAEQRVFAANCAGCHGSDGSGGPKGPAIATDRPIIALPDDALIRIVHEGVPGKGMPAFPELDDQATQAVVRYLRTLQGVTNIPGPIDKQTGDAVAGRHVFFGKGQCSTCHMVTGQGGFMASDLTAYSQGRDAKGIGDAILQVDTRAAPSSRVVQVRTSDGKKIRGSLRYEDNINLGLQAEDGRYYFLSRRNLQDVKYSDHSLMPRDYRTRLSAKELADLVSFLVVTGKNAPAEPAPARRGRGAAN